jgi:hypothetical protein
MRTVIEGIAQLCRVLIGMRDLKNPKEFKSLAEEISPYFLTDMVFKSMYETIFRMEYSKIQIERKRNQSAYVRGRQWRNNASWTICLD